MRIIFNINERETTETELFVEAQLWIKTVCGIKYITSIARLEEREKRKYNTRTRRDDDEWLNE